MIGVTTLRVCKLKVKNIKKEKVLKNTSFYYFGNYLFKTFFFPDSQNYLLFFSFFFPPPFLTLSKYRVSWIISVSGYIMYSFSCCYMWRFIKQFPSDKNQGKFTMPSAFMWSSLNGKIF